MCPTLHSPIIRAPNIDVYALGMVFLGISTTVGSMNFIVTLPRTRAPGMSLNRVPILVWGTVKASVGDLFAVPAVSLAFLSAVDGPPSSARISSIAPPAANRCSGSICSGCSAIPGCMRSCCPPWELSPTGCRVFPEGLGGVAGVALSTVTTMVLGFGVWVRHMFATGLA